jgi:hypothetical protein
LNPANIKAPFLKPDDIEAEALKVRNKYPSLAKVPIDVMGFAEFDLGLQFDFAPIRHLGQDAFLYPDLSGIWFDKASFKDHSQHNRLRFSAAHELGHLFLHSNIYNGANFKTIKQWAAFINEIPAAQYYWIESHADEFAGQFLIPSKELLITLNETVDDAEREGFFEQGKEHVLDFCCISLSKHFAVSFPAIQTRVRKSKFWPHPKVAQLPN